MQRVLVPGRFIVRLLFRGDGLGWRAVALVEDLKQELQVGVGEKSACGGVMLWSWRQEANWTAEGAVWKFAVQA
ncbi:hypothetical protein [Streptomyces sp. NPDC057280]|uniref:hypothetical protein n=1 Tax=Streptomyces sp. NPDC057280 TaxID=3346081 RepID=UPI003625DB79